MKVTVCEIRNDPAGFAEDWKLLADHVAQEKSDLLLLPEMPFSPWLARHNTVDPAAWTQASDAHESMIRRLGTLFPLVVAGTRPVEKNGARRNAAFLFEKPGRYRAVHEKCHLPDEPGFWEATWYEPGRKEFAVTDVLDIAVGFLICTEMWFFHHARDYARRGVHLLLCPRASPIRSADKWLAGGRTAAVVSGAFCLSSNFRGALDDGPTFGGTGWIVEPEEGDILGVTSDSEPFITREIDPRIAENAKKTYPRYVDG